LTKNSDADDFAPTWSPDGQWIAFTRIQDQQANIMVMRSDGTEVRQLTTTGAESAPAWSPDGTHIVFMSRHLNTEEEANTRSPKYFSNIYVMRSDGSERRPITSGPNNYEDPIWVRAPSQ
jgi:TolB protein